MSDDILDQAQTRFDKEQLASLLLSIASINVWNRLNVTPKQAVSRD